MDFLLGFICLLAICQVMNNIELSGKLDRIDKNTKKLKGK